MRCLEIRKGYPPPKLLNFGFVNGEFRFALIGPPDAPSSWKLPPIWSVGCRFGPTQALSTSATLRVPLRPIASTAPACPSATQSGAALNLGGKVQDPKRISSQTRFPSPSLPANPPFSLPLDILLKVSAVLRLRFENLDLANVGRLQSCSVSLTY